VDEAAVLHELHGVKDLDHDEADQVERNALEIVSLHQVEQGVGEQLEDYAEVLSKYEIYRLVKSIYRYSRSCAQSEAPCLDRCGSD